MKGHVRWLYGQLPRLVDEGVLAPEQASRLRERYGPLEASDPVARVLLVTASLASLLIGAGLILIVAHNWEDIPRVGRTALGFALLLGAQALAGFALVRRRDSESWTESTALFVVLALAACMAIVAQAWQIAWTPEGFLLSWILLSLPMIYVMRAKVLVPLAWLGIFCWGAAATDSWHDSRALLGVLAMALALLPAHVLLRREGMGLSRSHAAEWAAALALGLVVPSFWPEGLAWMKLPTVAAALALLYALGARLDRASSTRWQRAFHGVGGLGLFIVIFYASFAESWTQPDAAAWPASAGTWSLALLGVVAVAGSLALAGVGAFRGARPHVVVLRALPLLLVVVDAIGRRTEPGTAAIAVNALGALTGGLALWSGLREDSLLRSNAGLALIGALLAARFFDTEWSFAWRGSVFIALGICTLALNLWIVSRRRRKEVS